MDRAGAITGNWGCGEPSGINGATAAAWMGSVVGPGAETNRSRTSGSRRTRLAPVSRRGEVIEPCVGASSPGLANHTFGEAAKTSRPCAVPLRLEGVYAAASGTGRKSSGRHLVGGGRSSKQPWSEASCRRDSRGRGSRNAVVQSSPTKNARIFRCSSAVRLARIRMWSMATSQCCGL